MKSPSYFKRKFSIGILFIPMAIIYSILGFLNKLFSKPYKSKAKIICIGNVTLGGVGKTPLVIKTAEHFLKKGLKVGILSRGYKAKLSSKSPVVVDIKKHNPKDVGDEPFMMATKLKNIPVCICKNRGIGAKILEKQVDIIIMDDGLQNYTIKKDKSVLVINAYEKFGNGFIFPAGPLRENVKSAIKKIDVIMIMGESGTRFKNKLKKYNKPIFEANTTSKDWIKYKGKNVVAFAGIGNPEKLYHGLRHHHMSLKKTFSYPDHYDYSASDFEYIIREANGMPILTTMKDYVKIPSKYKKYIQVIDIDLDIKKEVSFFKILES